MKRLNQGYLQVDDIHKIYWAEYGNPKGKPILMFHGGPGSKFKKKHAKGKDDFRVIGFDQRGCGKSTPAGEIKNNTTQELIKDAKKLLDHLGIKKINLVGGSWGSTMALLFAETYPEIVNSIFVSAIFLARKEDDDWLYNGARLVYPDYNDKMLENIPENQRGNIAEYLLDKIENGTKKERENGALTISAYEHTLMLIYPSKEEFKTIATEEDINSSKIWLHYSKNNYFLSKSEQILNNLDKIKHIPTTIVHGRYDFCCPFKGAYTLHKNLPKSKLIIVDGENHGGKTIIKTLNEEIN